MRMVPAATPSLASAQAGRTGTPQRQTVRSRPVQVFSHAPPCSASEGSQSCAHPCSPSGRPPPRRCKARCEPSAQACRPEILPTDTQLIASAPAPRRWITPSTPASATGIVAQLLSSGTVRPNPHACSRGDTSTAFEELRTQSALGKSLLGTRYARCSRVVVGRGDPPSRCSHVSPASARSMCRR